jgi:hypothetical protein
MGHSHIYTLTAGTAPSSPTTIVIVVRGSNRRARRRRVQDFPKPLHLHLVFVQFEPITSHSHPSWAPVETTNRQGAATHLVLGLTPSSTNSATGRRPILNWDIDPCCPRPANWDGDPGSSIATLTQEYTTMIWSLNGLLDQPKWIIRPTGTTI